MKNKFCLLACIIITAVLSFTITACDYNSRNAVVKDKELLILDEFNKSTPVSERNNYFSKLTHQIKLSEKNFNIENSSQNNGSLNCDTDLLTNYTNFEIIYDLNQRPTFLLATKKDFGYAIINRLTGESMERSDEAVSPYQNYVTNKKYYCGYLNYFILNEDSIVNILSAKIISQDQKLFYANLSDYLVISNAKEVESIQKETGNYIIAPLTTNSERENYSTIMPNGNYFSSLTPGFDNHGAPYAETTYYDLGDNNFDMLFPSNDGSSCGIVAVTQLLQFYERRGTHVIPNKYLSRGFRTTQMTLSEYKNIGFWQKMETAGFQSQELHNTLNQLTWGGAFGENYTKNLMTGLDKFYSAYPCQNNEALRKIIPDYNMFYNNMVAAIDGGNPAIGMTSTGNGYYQQEGYWTNTGVARHQMIAYGYCTSKKGTLLDFICHSGWIKDGTSKMYVHKINFLSNFTSTLS